MTQDVVSIVNSVYHPDSPAIRAVAAFQDRPCKPFFAPDADMERYLSDVLQQLRSDFPTLGQTQIAITWVVYEPPYITNTGGGAYG